MMVNVNVFVMVMLIFDDFLVLVCGGFLIFKVILISWISVVNFMFMVENI